MSDWEAVEKKRLAIQKELDDLKTQEQRNQLGQFATPTELARQILRYGIGELKKNEAVQFLDPALGTGSFYSALRAVSGARRIESAMGFEIDAHYSGPTRKLWSRFKLNIREEDFTHARPADTEKANLLICNPPYVRHHHLSKAQKESLQFRTHQASNMRLSMLSGLYCYFLGLSQAWMREDGIAAWLIPSEFMDVNYGAQVKEYLLREVTLLHVHRFDPNDVQFSDALVSSAVVWLKNSKPSAEHSVRFSFGGSLEAPSEERHVSVGELADEKKWTRYPLAKEASSKADVVLGDLFAVKRGIATGDNKFFILTAEQIADLGLPRDCFRPVLPSSRYLKDDEIMSDEAGLPQIQRQLFLLDTTLSEEEIQKRHPKLAEYLKAGQKGQKPVSERYLCRSRKPWYAQENRPAAPFLCTYMGRPKAGQKPFRFILNHSQATACNVYLLLYPKPEVARAFMRDPQLKTVVWKFLNNIDSDELLSKGRVYGGGLHKMEPKELLRVDVSELAEWIPNLSIGDPQTDLFDLDAVAS